jgi:hypothetical protein
MIHDDDDVRPVGHIFHGILMNVVPQQKDRHLCVQLLGKIFPLAMSCKVTRFWK